VGFLGNLGTDSLHEAQSFDMNEALFWIQTFLAQFKLSLPFKIFIHYSSIAFAIYFLLRISFFLLRVKEKYDSYLKFSLGIIFIIVALNQSVWGTVSLFKNNTQAFKNVANNFAHPVPPANANPKLSVLLYIGESTSIMNMGLYGYPRHTTPLLNQLENKQNGFIKFDNVISTHTHTSSSLLEALSISVMDSENSLPIERRSRISLVDILNKADIATELFSNQGASGTWNQASSIIFKNAKKTFSTANSLLGNADDRIKKPWDHQFFNAHVTQNKLDSKPHSLIVFHSYAGHGGYKANIPKEFHNPVDEYFKGKNTTAITGAVDSLKTVEAYDSAIRYIDYSVANALELVKNSDKPWVFLYFADHGEAAFVNRGHDSSRFIHEMVRVPFVMYFNAAAKNSAPEMFQEYSDLSKKKNISTLTQLPATLFNLLGVTVSTDITPVIGAPIIPAPILVRETNEGMAAVKISAHPLMNSLVDKTDSVTAHFVASRNYELDGPLICYQSTNTIAKALRGSLVTNCLEIEIMVEEGEKVLVHQPHVENTGLMIEDVLSAVKAKDNLSFWLDGKNLSSSKSCKILLSFLKTHNLRESRILVEFPSGSHGARAEIGDCVNELKTIASVYTSYNVPTRHALNCSKALIDGKIFANESSSRALEDDLTAAKQSNLFTDISFDHGGVKAIEALRVASHFRWNSWQVKASELEAIKSSHFRMVILTNDDPNSMSVSTQS
jgi:glucan phosphoethanolaminetransferase (alkaline phosphatase superfamily)